jgi:hypothetical protein
MLGSRRPLLKETSDADVSQPQTAPHQACECHGKGYAGPWSADADLAGDGAAEISGQQDCSDDRGAGNDVQQCACQQQYADADDFGFGVPEFLNCGFHDDVGFHELHDSVHQKEEDCEAAYDAPGPELCIRNQENLRSQHTLARKIGRDSEEIVACAGYSVLYRNDNCLRT